MAILVGGELAGALRGDGRRLTHLVPVVSFAGVGTQPLSNAVFDEGFRSPLPARRTLVETIRDKPVISSERHANIPSAGGRNVLCLFHTSCVCSILL